MPVPFHLGNFYSQGHATFELARNGYFRMMVFKNPSDPLHEIQLIVMAVKTAQRCIFTRRRRQLCSPPPYLHSPATTSPIGDAPASRE